MVFMLLLIVNLQRKHACVIGSSSAISKQQFLLVCKVLLDCMPYSVLAWLYLMILYTLVEFGICGAVDWLHTID